LKHLFFVTLCLGGCSGIRYQGVCFQSGNSSVG
jgi:hypothetical protein